MELARIKQVGTFSEKELNAALSLSEVVEEHRVFWLFCYVRGMMMDSQLLDFINWENHTSSAS